MRYGLWVLLMLLLTGCTTVHDLGGGRYVVPRVAEVRSPFGTNMGYVMLETCDGVVRKEHGLQPIFPTMEYVNCQGLTDWEPLGSQGQGGQVVQGALTGIGLGVLGATMPGSSSSSASTATAITAPGKGRH